MTAPDDLFNRAREAEVADVAGVKLFRAGHRLRGQCPVCSSGEKKRASGPFWVDPRIGRWGCFAGQGDCEPGGDVIRLEQLLRGGTPREAAERLAGPGSVLPAPRPRGGGRRVEGSRTPDDDWQGPLARRLWAESIPAEGTPAMTYLMSRGIPADLARAACRDGLRYHPAAWWGGHPVRSPILYPAMLCRPQTDDGPTGGLHLTYVCPDGVGKIGRDPAKRMLGRQTDGEGRPGGAVLIGGQEGPLIEAEGTENALSAAAIWMRENSGRIPNVAAALSLRSLQGGWLADRFGRYDPDLPWADPERPGFTLSAFRARAVLVAVDRDMKAVRSDGRPFTVRARRACGGTWDRPLSSDDRARISGALAVQSWQRAGANPVRVIAPSPGRDFNDDLLSDLSGSEHG